MNLSFLSSSSRDLIAGSKGAPLDPVVKPRDDRKEESAFDAALIITDHDGVDYAALAAAVPLVVDTRNSRKKAV